MSPTATITKSVIKKQTTTAVDAVSETGETYYTTTQDSNIAISSLTETSASKIVPLQQLESEELFLKKPLYVNLEVDHEGNVIMSSSDLEIFGYGETEYEAKRDFVTTLTDLYYSLKNEQDNLHKNSLPIWFFLQRIISEQ